MKRALLLISLVFAGLFLSGCHAEYPAIVEGVKVYKVGSGYYPTYYVTWTKLSSADEYNIYLMDSVTSSGSSGSSYSTTIASKIGSVGSSANWVKFTNLNYSTDLAVSISADIDGEESYLSEKKKFSSAKSVSSESMLPSGYTAAVSF